LSKGVLIVAQKTNDSTPFSDRALLNMVCEMEASLSQLKSALEIRLRNEEIDDFARYADVENQDDFAFYADATNPND
jgi:hypothetical protein